jgi:hypothetical protein
MSSTESELQKAIVANLDESPRAVSIFVEDDESQERRCVAIDDVLGDFCEQTGAQFG